MAWIQIKIDTLSGTVDALSELLSAAGAAAVTLESAASHAVYEPPPNEVKLWQETRIVGLFSDDIDLKSLLVSLTGHHYTLETLEERDWERAWMENFHPLCFGQRLWIVPSWHTPPDPAAINILLDPGLAFGTGSHPTTALCLQWLDSHSPHDLNVIDYGCGSGILAIAAAKLGARHTWAIDHDPQAIEATLSNAHNNGVTALITAGDATLAAPPAAVDLLLANILAQPLIEFAPRFAQYVRPGGRVVLSGVLDHQIDAVAAHYHPWFTLQPATCQEEWGLIEGTRHST